VSQLSHLQPQFGLHNIPSEHADLLQLCLLVRPQALPILNCVRPQALPILNCVRPRSQEVKKSRSQEVKKSRSQEVLRISTQTIFRTLATPQPASQHRAGCAPPPPFHNQPKGFNSQRDDCILAFACLLYNIRTIQTLPPFPIVQRNDSIRRILLSTYICICPTFSVGRKLRSRGPAKNPIRGLVFVLIEERGWCKQLAPSIFLR
jgi:hypothetical protein